MKTLVTGFEGYGAHGVNPTEELARAIDGLAKDEIDFVGAVLPVTYEGLGRRIVSLIEEYRPDIVILLGLWPGEPCIRVERFALNLNDFEIPDNAGVIKHGPIEENAALAHPSGLPVDRIVEDLLSAGIPARASSSAGNFLCNALFFNAIEAVARRDLPARVGFVHVPYLPSQVAHVIRVEERLERHQRADLASMALEMQLAAVRTIARSTKASLS